MNEKITKQAIDVKYLIIGNSAAGVAAMEHIRQYDQTGEMIVVSDEPYHTYSRPLISYLLEGKTTEQKMRFRDDSFYKSLNVKTRLGVSAQQLDTNKQTVTLSNGEIIRYEKLLIAVGSVPFVPPIPGCPAMNIGKGAFTFIKLADALALQQAIDETSKVVVIGGGLTGVKATEGMLHLTKQITLVELAPRVLPNALDDTAAGIIEKRLRAAGVSVNCDTSVSEVLTGSDGNVTAVRLSDGRLIDCDALVVSIGVRPNLALVKGTEIKVERGIVIDSHCETSVSGVFAAGDCVESHDLTDDSQRILAILPNAYQQGKVAGTVMTGAELKDKGARPINATSFLGLPLITAGKTSMTSEQAQQQNAKIVIQGVGENYKKLVMKDNRLIGFILLGHQFTRRAGILTDLLRREIDLTSVADIESSAPELLMFDRLERIPRMRGVTTCK